MDDGATRGSRARAKRSRQDRQGNAQPKRLLLGSLAILAVQARRSMHLTDRNNELHPGDCARVCIFVRRPWRWTRRSCPEGANHARAHRYATGEDVIVGVFDTVPYGIASPHRLGDRLLAQYSFVGKLPSQEPDPLSLPVDDHERLVADIIAGDDPVFTGVAPAALIYDAAIDSTSFDSRRAASGWLAANHGVQIYNLSSAYGTNTNGTSTESLYWDWFVHEKNALVVVAAGNTGGQIAIPADSYNVITVGAYDQADLKRWQFSSYTLSGGVDGTGGPREARHPGPRRVGRRRHQLRRLLLPRHQLRRTPRRGHRRTAHRLRYRNIPPPTRSSPRGIKALILNSARKRQIVGPEATRPYPPILPQQVPRLTKTTSIAACAPCTINNPSYGRTDRRLDARRLDAASGGKFTVTKPLDDEQGVGYLDATRAIINLAGRQLPRPAWWPASAGTSL